jgi:hypothetical protein
VLVPEAREAEILSSVWKCELRTSSRPYAKPQRKKRIVKSRLGRMDCLSVRWTALTSTWSSETVILRLNRPIVAAYGCRLWRGLMWKEMIASRRNRIWGSERGLK